MMICPEAYKKPLVIVSVMLIVLGIGYLYAQSSYKPVAVIPGGPGVVEPQRMSVSGTYTCLPHRDTSGPQTMECALGLKVDEQTYYALDLDLLSSEVPPTLAVGDKVSANGVMTPVEMLSSDQWQKYNIKGIFSVTDSLRVEKVTSPETP